MQCFRLGIFLFCAFSIQLCWRKTEKINLVNLLLFGLILQQLRLSGGCLTPSFRISLSVTFLSEYHYQILSVNFFDFLSATFSSTLYLAFCTKSVSSMRRLSDAFFQNIVLTATFLRFFVCCIFVDFVARVELLNQGNFRIFEMLPQ